MAVFSAVPDADVRPSAALMAQSPWKGIHRWQGHDPAVKLGQEMVKMSVSQLEMLKNGHVQILDCGLSAGRAELCV